MDYSSLAITCPHTADNFTASSRSNFITFRETLYVALRTFDSRKRSWCIALCISVVSDSEIARVRILRIRDGTRRADLIRYYKNISRRILLSGAFNLNGEYFCKL